MKVVPDVALTYRQNMPTDRDSIQALKNIIEQIELLISTTVELPENRTIRCRELLRAADALVDDLMKQSA
jgi:hypothetical protein